MRFRFDSGSSVAADGVYVDEIHIEDASATAQKLWPVASGGTARMWTASKASRRNLSRALEYAWYAGGQWNTTNTGGYYKTGSLALTDSPVGNYLDSTFSVLEMVPIIDMTSTVGGQQPDDDVLDALSHRSECLVPRRYCLQGRDDRHDREHYDQIGGWSAWTTQPMMVGVPAPATYWAVSVGGGSRYLAARTG